MSESVSGLRGYGRVLTHGPAVRPFVATVIGRLPVGMTGLGMVMLVQQVTGLYAVAGIVTGAFALATAVGAPIWGRLMDRHGQPWVLLPIALVSGVAIAAVALATVAHASPGVLVALAIVSGVFFPPLSPAMRAAWRVIFHDDALRRFGYALDASAVELIFVLGPLLLSLLAAFLPPVVPLLVSASLLVIGTVLYCLTDAARTRPQVVASASGAGSTEPDAWAAGAPGSGPGPVAPGSTGGQPVGRFARAASGSAFTAPGIALMLVVSGLMAVGFGQLDTAIVATADEVLGSTTMLGILFGFIAGGSCIGGIAYGARSWPGSDRGRLVVLLSTFAAALVPWPFLLVLEHPPLPVLFALLFVTGLTIAPALIIFQQLLDELAPPHQMTEAQSLLSASQTTGAAAGMAIAGFTVDAWAAPGGLAGAALAVGAAALLAGFIRLRWTKAHTHRPSADIAPVATPA